MAEIIGKERSIFGRTIAGYVKGFDVCKGFGWITPYDREDQEVVYQIRSKCEKRKKGAPDPYDIFFYAGHTIKPSFVQVNDQNTPGQLRVIPDGTPVICQAERTNNKNRCLQAVRVQYVHVSTESS